MDKKAKAPVPELPKSPQPLPTKDKTPGFVKGTIDPPLKK